MVAGIQVGSLLRQVANCAEINPSTATTHLQNTLTLAFLAKRNRFPANMELCPAYLWRFMPSVGSLIQARGGLDQLTNFFPVASNSM
jgi:hypothetical protein